MINLSRVMNNLSKSNICQTQLKPCEFELLDESDFCLDIKITQ